MFRLDYEKYRWFLTSSGKLVVGGKSALQNEELMRHIDNNDVIMHTASPGSPFCIIQNPNAKDMEEAAIFTACFSHDWKNKKQKSEIHIFGGEQVIKRTRMKTGTFGIAGDVFKKKVELKLALDLQRGVLRAVPPASAKKPRGILIPGSMGKEKAAEKIRKIMKERHEIPVSIEEVMAAIPSDGIHVSAV